LRAEAAGGISLSLGMMVALLWSGMAPDHYHDFWHHQFGASSLSTWHVGNPHEVVANAVLTIFFFGVGLELARELRQGHLTDKKNAIMPALAALGGMITTALFAVILGATSHTPALTKGWGIPMATDIAFALGALALVGRRIPRELRIFLLTLAIVDDVLSVIALALSDPSKIQPLYLALLPATVFLLSFKSRQRMVLTMLTRVVATWLVLAAANVEPCLAGAIVGLVAPFGSNPDASERLEHRVVLLATWIALPLFALTACGIDWRAISWSPATWTFIGLMAVARLVGKIVGIVGVVTLASRLGFGTRPGNVKQLTSLASLCAVGFTVPLLFAEQAYGATNPTYFQTTAALLAVSVLAAVIGCAGLWVSGSSTKGNEQ
jgi:NhaA family Na+:H+ antiporter